MTLLVSMPDVEDVSFSLSLTTRITARRSDQCYILVVRGRVFLLSFWYSRGGGSLSGRFVGSKF